MRTQRSSGNLNPRARPIITREVKATMYLCLIKQHIVPPEGVKVRIHAFLTSTLDRGEKSLSLPDQFTHANNSSGMYWG
jgi:hypothetical protein